MPTLAELRAKAKEHDLRVVELSPLEYGYRYCIRRRPSSGARMYARTLVGAEWLLDRYIFEEQVDKEHRAALMKYRNEHPCPKEEEG